MSFYGSSGLEPVPGHALLAPSSSERWIQCPASVRMSKDAPQSTSPYALEGTRAHELAEMSASHIFGIITTAVYQERYRDWLTRAREAKDDIEAMQLHVAGYVDLIEDRLARHPMSQLLLEQRVKTGIPGCWGTGDAIIVSPVHIEVIDLKYGQGIQVDAEGNTQLRLYGVGALETFSLLGDAQMVYMTIYQPRLDSVPTASMAAKALLAWRDSILPVAEEALGDNAHFSPSEEACRYCPAAGTCRARVEKMTREDFGVDPDNLSPEELGELLHRIPEIRQWCSSVTDNALKIAHFDGVEIPGWKVVLGRGRRVVEDEVAAVQTLIDAGFNAEQVAKLGLRKLGDLDKAVGAKKLADLLGPLLTKTPGNPALVDETDPRPAVSPELEAAKEFS